MVGDLRRSVLERTHRVGSVIGYQLALVIHKVTRTTEVHDFDIKFRVQQHVLGFNVTVRYPPTVHVP
jgi:hypothetical protein